MINRMLLLPPLSIAFPSRLALFAMPPNYLRIDTDRWRHNGSEL